MDITSQAVTLFGCCQFSYLLSIGLQLDVRDLQVR